MIIALLTLIALTAALAGLWLWRRRREASLVARLAAGPVPVQRLRSRLVRRWGALATESPLSWAIGELAVSVVDGVRGYSVLVRWPLGAPGRLDELEIHPRRTSAVTVDRGASPRTVRMRERATNPLGDAAFDDALRLGCGLSVALPLLTPEVMRLVIALDSLSLRDGELRGVVGRTALEADQAVHAIAAVVELAQALSRAAATPAEMALAIGARAHRSTAMRLKSLQELEDRFPRGEVLQDALRVALSDPAPILRLEAGQALGEAGRDGLWLLALDEHAPESLRVAALLALTRGEAGFDLDEARLDGLIAPRTAPTLTVTVLRLLSKRPPAAYEVGLACRALASDSEEVLLTAINFLEHRAEPLAAGPLLDVAADPSLTARVRERAKRVGERLSRPSPSLRVLRPAIAPQA